MVSFLVLVSAPDFAPVWRQLLPLPTYMRLWACCIFTSMPDLLARLRREHRLINYVFSSAEAALVRGVYCPGLDCVAVGRIHVDVGPPPLQTQVLAALGVDHVDEVALGPLVRDCTAAHDGTVHEAWHVGNGNTAEWISLSVLLGDATLQILDFKYYRPGQMPHYFVACCLIETFRFAFIFHAEPGNVITVN
eukprot:Skav223670  [mRNA]  locus=scaffold2794:289608:290183:- [translate_table: standard]